MYQWNIIFRSEAFWIHRHHFTSNDTSFKIQHENTVQSHVLAVWAGFTFFLWPPVLPVYRWTSPFVLHIIWPHSDTPYVIVSLSQLSSEIWYVGQPCLNRQLLCHRIFFLQDIFCLHFILIFLSYLRFICQVLVLSYICVLMVWHSPCDSMNLKYLKTSNLTIVFSLVDRTYCENVT
jgi:hypothetical protein